MSANARLFGRDLEIDTANSFLNQMQAASAVALTPARNLEPVTLRARNVAVQLAGTFTKVANLAEQVFGERARIESDSTTKPQILRVAWSEFGASAVQTADQYIRAIPTLQSEVREALQDLALPVTADPAAALLARQDVEARMRSGERGTTGSASTLSIFLELAARGGDTAAAAASAWGRDIYVAANGGDDTGFGSVVAAAIETSIASEDADRRKAAAALQALDKPTGEKTKTQALYTAGVFANQLLGTVKKIAGSGPVLTG